MPRVAVCFKWVVDEADLKVDPSSHVIRTERAGMIVSTYDRNAIEAGVALVEAQGGEVAAISVGGPAVKAAFKDALSRGPHRGVYVADPALEDAPVSLTAKVLAAVLQRDGPYDVLLFGEGSNDLYAQQVGPRVGQLLGLPVVAFASGVDIDGGVATVVRHLEDGVERVRVPLPVVITVSPDMNKPRIPGMKQIMSAARKPIEEVALSDLGLSADGRPSQVTVRGAVMDRKHVRLTGDLPEMVAEAVRAIVREGVLQ